MFLLIYDIFFEKFGARGGIKKLEDKLEAIK